MSTLTLTEARPIYTADHTGRPTFHGERKMRPIELDGVRVGYVFDEHAEAFLHFVSSNPVKEQSDVEKSQGAPDGASQAAARAETEGNLASRGDAGHTGRPEALAAVLSSARGGTAVTADGRSPVGDGTGARSGEEQVEEEGVGERQPLEVPQPVRRIGSKTAALCQSCNWHATIVVVGDTRAFAPEMTHAVAVARHGRESVCDEPDILIDLDQVYSSFV